MLEEAIKMDLNGSKFPMSEAMSRRSTKNIWQATPLTTMAEGS